VRFICVRLPAASSAASVTLTIRPGALKLGTIRGDYRSVQRLVCQLAIASVACALLALSPPAASADAPSNCAGADLSPTSADLPQVEAATLCLLNAERTSSGLAPLRTNGRLRNAAVAHSADMVASHYFAHEDRSGGGPEDRIARAGYLPRYGPWVVGENIAWGTDYLATPREIVRAWMNSPPHRHNILYSDYRQIGIGLALGVPDPSLGDGATYSTEFGAKSRQLAQARRAHRARARRGGGRKAAAARALPVPR
jgi:uncharacterized protein YkwD